MFLKYGCIPISYESDGLLILAPKDAPLGEIDTLFMRPLSQELIGQPIPISVGDFDTLPESYLEALVRLKGS